MEQYSVTGMSCAACSTRVEKAVRGVSGVTECSVSLLTNSMGVEGTATETEIIKAVEAAGYGAAKKSMQKGKNTGTSAGALQESLEDHETPKLLRRLIWSVGILLVLMYFSMGHMMWNWPIPSVLTGNHVAMGLIQLLLSGAILAINQKFFINGIKGVIHRSPNMDTLVALGSGTSFIYSIVMLFVMTDAVLRQDHTMVMKCMDNFYFESAAMILVLITVGKMLETRSKGKTTNALKALLSLAPKNATLFVDGKEIEVQIEEVRPGDIFILRPGSRIPVDGRVVEGNSAVDESALTGESIPVDKELGNRVSAGTMNQSGYMKCEALEVGEDTTLSQIIQMVSDAAATKAPIAKVADKVSGIFVPVVIAISLVTMFIWAVVGEDVGFVLSRGIAVLVISCPCALGLATPVAIMVGNGVGARNGILFKTAIALENAGRTQIVALDKTGTITNGTPEVTKVLPNSGVTEDELLQCAAALEKKSEHPLAKAIVRYAQDHGIDDSSVSVEDFEVLPGNGVKASNLLGGSMKFMQTKVIIEETLLNKADELAEAGHTPMCFAKDGKAIGIIGVADTIKEDSVEAVKQLHNMGLHVVMLTGDNEKTANAIAKRVGVDEVVAGVLPNGKESVVRRLMEQGKVAMVGDGINDAPALTRADTGIAIGAGTDVAIDAADVVLMKNNLLDVPAAIRLSRKTLKNIHENLFWAFIYNIIGIPLAAGVWYPIFGWELNPMFGAAAMGLSSFCVVTNALRINMCKVHDDKYDKKIKFNLNKKENEIMTKTITIEGMMCTHCSGHVTKALEELEHVTKAEVSHETGKAVVTLDAEVSAATFKTAVESAGYTFVGIE